MVDRGAVDAFCERVTELERERFASALVCTGPSAAYCLQWRGLRVNPDAAFRETPRLLAGDGDLPLFGSELDRLDTALRGRFNADPERLEQGLARLVLGRWSMSCASS